jgi:DNA-directed RNA polymerase subunit RPC12/RpoP
MTEPLRIINMKCINCGAQLEISPDMTSFACGYCGAEQIVQHSGGTVALRAVTDAVVRVQAGTDKTAAELALLRLQADLRQLDDDVHLKRKTASIVREQWPTQSIAVFLVGIVLASIVAVLTNLALADWTAGVFFGVVLVGGGAAYVLKLKAADQLDTEVNRTISDIETRRREIREQIEKNRQIVNS